jgi:hypothetical protein
LRLRGVERRGQRGSVHVDLVGELASGGLGQGNGVCGSHNDSLGGRLVNGGGGGHRREGGLDSDVFVGALLDGLASGLLDRLDRLDRLDTLDGLGDGIVDRLVDGLRNRLLKWLRSSLLNLDLNQRLGHQHGRDLCLCLLGGRFLVVGHMAVVFLDDGDWLGNRLVPSDNWLVELNRVGVRRRHGHGLELGLGLGNVDVNVNQSWCRHVDVDVLWLRDRVQDLDLHGNRLVDNVLFLLHGDGPVFRRPVGLGRRLRDEVHVLLAHVDCAVCSEPDKVVVDRGGVDRRLRDGFRGKLGGLSVDQGLFELRVWLGLRDGRRRRSGLRHRTWQR